MIEALIGLLTDIWETVTPVYILSPYEGGVRISNYPWGQKITTIGPGLNWKWPIIGAWETVTTALTTQHIGPQSLVTEDGKNFVVNGVVKYRVKDPRPLCCDVEDEIDVLQDVSLSAVRQVLSMYSWTWLISRDSNLEVDILKLIKKGVWGMGFDIQSYTITDLAPIKTIRLITE